MPKCGGTSVRLALEKLLGSDYLKFDYAGVPGAGEVARYRQLLKYIDNPDLLAPGCCVYGHFRPVKYLGPLGASTEDVLLITILREPIDRLVSHYRYLLALNDFSDPMRVSLKDHQDDFAWFAMQPRLRNIYARHLYQIPLARVSYFGLYEHLDSAWSKISSMLRPGQNVFPLPKANGTDNRSSVLIPRPQISQLLLTELEELHAEDVALYKYVCQQELGFVKSFA